MSMPGIGEPTLQVVVYGPDGTMYPTPAHARAAGVTNYTMQQPVTEANEIIPRMPDSNRIIPRMPTPFEPYLPGFRDDEIIPRNGVLPPAQQMPMPMQPLQMPSSMQMPSMNLQAPEFGIVDPTYMAQLEILNQGGMNQSMGMPMGQPMGLLGSGLGPQERGPVAPFLTIPNYRPMAQSFRNEKAAAAGGGMSGAGGGGGGGDGGGNGFGMEQSAFSQMSPAEQAAYYAENPTMAAITRAGQKAFSYTTPGLLQSALVPDFVADQYTIASGYDPTNTDPLSADSVATELSRAGYDDLGGYNDANTSTKIVCTAMNEAYGFGSFRNRIWLAYAAKNLTKAHEAGYHALFLPLVNAGYKQDKWFSKPLRAALENIARHRSADLRAEMRGGKRDRVGQAYRFILEPLCYAVGKLKGN